MALTLARLFRNMEAGLRAPTVALEAGHAYPPIHLARSDEKLKALSFPNDQPMRNYFDYYKPNDLVSLFRPRYTKDYARYRQKFEDRFAEEDRQLAEAEENNKAFKPVPIKEHLRCVVRDLTAEDKEGASLGQGVLKNYMDAANDDDPPNACSHRPFVA